MDPDLFGSLASDLVRELELDGDDQSRIATIENFSMRRRLRLVVSPRRPRRRMMD